MWGSSYKKRVKLPYPYDVLVFCMRNYLALFTHGQNKSNGQNHIYCIYRYRTFICFADILNNIVYLLPSHAHACCGCCSNGCAWAYVLVMVDTSTLRLAARVCVLGSFASSYHAKD